MGLFNIKTKESAQPGGRISLVRPKEPDPHIPRRIAGVKARSLDLLRELRTIYDVYDAITFITEKHPDASMAVQSYVRLANNGHAMEIFGPGGERDDAAERAWRQFCQRIGGNTKGFDGIIDQCHSAQVRYGGLGAEVVVRPDLSDVEDVHLLLPQWLTWEMDDAGVWHPFQQQKHERVDLSQGNFLWVALDSDVGKPTGPLLLESALLAIDTQLQFFKDSSAVLRRAGYPRNDLAIDREAVIKSLPSSVRNDQKRLGAALESYFDKIVGLLRKLEPTDDLIHFDDIVVNKTGGNDSGRTMDVRAYNEMLDSQVMNGLANMGVMLNRTTGQTETWGTVQFKIMVQTIKNLQQGSKRLAESICGLWMRVHGLQGACRFTHNPVDWETELQKLNAGLKKQELHRRAEEYEWENKGTAAKEAMGIAELPETDGNTLFAYVSRKLGGGAADEKQSKDETTDG